jgi:hypothetical protein
VIERLLLDRVHRNSSRTSVPELNQSSVLVFADKAEPRLPLREVAMSRTKITVETPIRHGFPPAGVVSSGFLQRGKHSYSLILLRLIEVGLAKRGVGA